MGHHGFRKTTIKEERNNSNCISLARAVILILNEIKIKYFLVLAEYLNFSAAAKALHITQQALSKQISQLEQELDCVLFTRTPRGVALTQAGEVMQKTFYGFQRGIEQAMVEIHNNERSNGRVLNIGCAAGLRPRSIFRSALPKILRGRVCSDMVWTTRHL